MKHLGILLTLALGLASCTGKDTIARQHEQMKAQEPAPLGHYRPLDVMNDTPENMRERYLTERTSSTELLQGIILPLEVQLVNVQKLSDPNIVQGDFTTWLNIYTEALLKAVKLSPQDPQVIAAMNRYVNLSMTNCSQELRNCSFNNALRVSSNTSQILIWKADTIGVQIEACMKQHANSASSCNSLVAEKYRFLLQAKELDSNALKKSNFNRSYLEHANLIQGLPTSSFIRQTNASLFNTIIIFFDPFDSTASGGCDVVKRYGTWTYSLSDPAASSAVTRRLFELSAMCDMYTEGQNLSPSFQQAIHDIQFNSAGAPSFRQRLINLTQKEEQRIIFERYGLNSSLRRAVREPIDYSFYNEYFFIFDRFFYGHISYPDAQQLLSKANRDYEKMLETLDVYLRIQLVANLIETKIYLKNAIFNKEVQNISSKIFERAIQDSTAVSSNWKSFFETMGFMLDAAKTPVDQRMFIQPSLKASFDKTYEKVTHLPTTIKIMVTYPSMMALAHMLAEDEATVAFKTWWGVDINQSASTVYDNLWKGTIAPWFDLGDTQPINKFYLLYAFDYALKSDFISLQKTETETVSVVDLQKNYVQVLFAKYLGLDRADLENMYGLYVGAVEGDEMINDFRAQCAYEVGTAVQAPKVTRALEDLSLQIHSGLAKGVVKNMASPALAFFERAKPPPPPSGLGQDTANINVNKPIFTHIYDKMFPKLQLARVLRDIAVKNGVSKEAIDIINEEIRLTEEVIVRVLRHFAQKVDSYSQCLKRFALIENYYDHLAYESEKVYLREVWQDMYDLQNDILNQTGEVKPDNVFITALNDKSGKYQDSTQVVEGTRDPHSLYFDRFTSASTFVYTNYDFMMRLVRNLQSGNIQNHDAGTLSEMKIEQERRFSKWMQKPLHMPRQWEVLMPKTRIQDWDVIKSQKFVNLSWDPNQETFVNQGIKALKGDDASFVKWHSRNNTIVPLLQMLEMRIFLHLTEQKMARKVGLDVKLADVFDSMKDLLRFTLMTPHEAQHAMNMGFESKMPMDELKDVIVDLNKRESIHPFTYLYNSFRTRIGMDPTLYNMLPNTLSSVGTVMADSVLLARNMNDYTFTLQFDSHKWIDTSASEAAGKPTQFEGLKTRYTQLAHHYLRRLHDFRNALATEPGEEYAQGIFRIQDGTKKTLEQGNLISLENRVVHPQRLQDMDLFISDFTKKTQNFFETKDLFEQERRNDSRRNEDRR